MAGQQLVMLVFPPLMVVRAKQKNSGSLIHFQLTLQRVDL